MDSIPEDKETEECNVYNIQEVYEQHSDFVRNVATNFSIKLPLTKNKMCIIFHIFKYFVKSLFQQGDATRLRNIIMLKKNKKKTTMMFLSRKSL